MIVIEKNIPMPDKNKTGPKSSEWDPVFNVIQKGDSFLLPTEKHHSIYTVAKERGWKISVRADGPKTKRIFAV